MLNFPADTANPSANNVWTLLINKVSVDFARLLPVLFAKEIWIKVVCPSNTLLGVRSKNSIM